MRQPEGGGGYPGLPGPPRRVNPPPKGRPGSTGHPRPNPVALHPLMSCPGGPGAGGGFPACASSVRCLRPAGPQPGLPGPRHVIRGAPWDGPPTGGGRPQLRPRLTVAGTVLASLLTRRLVDADLELESALGRDPVCSYRGPEGTPPSRIDGLLVDMRLAKLLQAVEWLPRGASPGHAPVRFDLHPKGSSQRVVKFVRPKPVALAPREENERLLLTQRLLNPLEASWQAPLSTGDVDEAWAFWTTAAEGTLLAVACPDITPDSVPAGATLPVAPPHLPRGKGTDELLQEVRLYPKQRRDTEGPLTCPLARI